MCNRYERTRRTIRSRSHATALHCSASTSHSTTTRHSDTTQRHGSTAPTPVPITATRHRSRRHTSLLRCTALALTPYRTAAMPHRPAPRRAAPHLLYTLRVRLYRSCASKRQTATRFPHGKGKPFHAKTKKEGDPLIMDSFPF